MKSVGYPRRPVEKAARLMVERFGRTALQQIDQRIYELSAHGEDDAVRLWRDIREATKSLLGEGGNGQTH